MDKIDIFIVILTTIFVTLLIHALLYGVLNDINYTSKCSAKGGAWAHGVCIKNDFIITL